MLYKMKNLELKIELGKFDEDISIVRRMGVNPIVFYIFAWYGINDNSSSIFLYIEGKG